MPPAPARTLFGWLLPSAGSCQDLRKGKAPTRALTETAATAARETSKVRVKVVMVPSVVRVAGGEGLARQPAAEHVVVRVVSAEQVNAGVGLPADDGLGDELRVVRGGDGVACRVEREAAGAVEVPLPLRLRVGLEVAAALDGADAGFRGERHPLAEAGVDRIRQRFARDAQAAARVEPEGAPLLRAVAPEHGALLVHDRLDVALVEIQVERRQRHRFR